MPEITVASFNVHWGIGPNGAPFDVAGAIRGLDADVIALQEVWEPAGHDPWVERVAEQIGAEAHRLPLAPDTIRPRPRVVRPDPAAPGSWGLAVLSRLPCIGRHAVDLGRVPFDAAGRRDALCLELDAADTKVSFTNVHVSHWPWGSTPQLARLGARLPRNGPAIVAGDLNMWGPVVSRALPGWRRATRGVGKTWPAHRPHSQIDHVLVVGGIDVADAVVLADLGSDHRPVRCRLRLP